MSLIRRMLLTEGVEEMPYAFEKILGTEFTLEESITSTSITSIATIETGLVEGDLEIGEVLIAEILMLEDLDTENVEKIRQLTRYECLSVIEGYYCGAGYAGGNPAYGYNPSTGAYSTYMAAQGGIFISSAGKFMSTLTIAGRDNGNLKPVAGRYQFLLYRTGINFCKDYQQ